MLDGHSPRTRFPPLTRVLSCVGTLLILTTFVVPIQVWLGDTFPGPTIPQPVRLGDIPVLVVPAVVLMGCTLWSWVDRPTWPWRTATLLSTVVLVIAVIYVGFTDHGYLWDGVDTKTGRWIGGYVQTDPGWGAWLALCGACLHLGAVLTVCLPGAATAALSCFARRHPARLP